MKIIKLLLVASLIVASSLSSFAQKKGDGSRNEDWRKEMLDFKIKFLSNEMELRKEQQKDFSTIYTKMMEEKNAAMMNAKKAAAQLKKLKSPTDEDYKSVSDAIRKAREEDASIENKFDEKFSTFLSQKQIFKMKEGERKFRDKLMKMRHNHRGKRKANSKDSQ